MTTNSTETFMCACGGSWAAHRFCEALSVHEQHALRTLLDDDERAGTNRHVYAIRRLTVLSARPAHYCCHLGQEYGWMAEGPGHMMCACQDFRPVP